MYIKTFSVNTEHLIYQLTVKALTVPVVCSDLSFIHSLP